jgi:hypothetical protein
MNHFDDEAAVGRTQVEGEYYRSRGTHAFDGGYGRDGVMGNAYDTQQQYGNSFVAALPKMINAQYTELYKLFGPILDAIQRWKDDNVRRNDEAMMNDQERDTMFATNVRNATGSKISRFEAFTAARQLLGKANDPETIKKFQQPTVRHTDGPNDSREGWQYTVVWSILIVWKGLVYRFSIIAYTRSSCGNYINRNNRYQEFAEQIGDYIVDKNGGQDYDNIYLQDDMSHMKIHLLPTSKGDRSNGLGSKTILVPPKQMIDATFLSRNPFSTWHQYTAMEAHFETVTWRTLHEYVPASNELYRGFQFFCVHEFMCRYGFVSGFASIINQFAEKEKLKRKQVIALVYCALLSPSTLTFYAVLYRWMIDCYKGPKYNEAPTLVDAFYITCNQYGVEPRGGLMPRYDAQASHSHPCHPNCTTDYTIQQILEFLAIEIERLDRGNYLTTDGRPIRMYPLHKSNPSTKRDNDIIGIGSKYGMSFPALCVFTGLVTSREAVSVARQAVPNTKVNPKKPYRGYYTKMCEAIPILNNPTELDLYRIHDATCRLVGGRQADMENGSCGKWRGQPRADCFMKGMNLYTIQGFTVKEQKYGNSVFEKFVPPLWPV